MSSTSTYPTAKTFTGEVVLADKAAKSDTLFCLSCGQQMLLKRGEIRIAHFAHKVVPETCSYETVLHSSFKHLLFQRISESLTQQISLLMFWNCSKCYEKHQGNLLKKARDVKLEHSFGTCQPDLTLFDSNGNPIVFIEIVVTHQPEANVLAYCKAHKITLVKFELKKFEDLERLEADILDPNYVDCCIAPPPPPQENTQQERRRQLFLGKREGEECPKCKSKTQYPKTMRAILVSCWKCGNNVSLCFVQSGGRVLYGPEYFDVAEFDVLKRRDFLRSRNPLSIDIRRFTDRRTGAVKTFCYCHFCVTPNGLNYYYDAKTRYLKKNSTLEGKSHRIVNSNLRDFPFGKYCTNCDYWKYKAQYGWW